MPKKPNFILEVTIRHPEAYTLDTVARDPRQFKPKDVLSASDNLTIEVKTGQPPDFIQPFVTWMLRDYFALAHRTGLYNRQKNLWESLSKTGRIEVAQQTVGIFKREPVPVYEIVLQDYKQKPLVFALFVAGNLPRSEKNDFVYLFKNFLSDSKKMTTITGMFACFAGDQFPDDVLKFLKKHSEPDHPVGRYEAMITGYGGPVNLVSCRTVHAQPSSNGAGSREESDEKVSDNAHDSADEVQTEVVSDNFEFDLVYPDLARKSGGLKL